MQINMNAININAININRSLQIQQRGMSESEGSENNSIKLQENMEGQQNEKPFANEQISQLDKEGSTRKRIHRKSQISNFIMKTYKILEDKKNSHIIEWTDGGNCFIVKNKDLFENQILPKYFKHRKFSSFVRQLNMYDFHKIRKEKEIPIFKHKFFKMNFYDLLHKIKRKSGEDAKEEDMDNAGPSLGEIGPASEANLAFSFKSKTSMNASEEIDALLYQNSELRNSIADISKEIMQFEINKDKKKEKLMKMMSALVFFDLQAGDEDEQYSLRDLQNHFINDDEPLSLKEYMGKLAQLYHCIKHNLIK